MSSEEFRWMLDEDFVELFNDWWAKNFCPGENVVVDESMSRWYGHGGHWINAGLPHYVAIDRKPENGAEIQNAACGKSGVLIQLKLVKSHRIPHEQVLDFPATDPAGTKIVCQLLQPWQDSRRTVCADSAFASVVTAARMDAMGLLFIGPVKTATKSFPMDPLSKVKFIS